MDELLAHETAVRLGMFLAVLCGVAIWEAASPRRRHEIPRLLRWSSNLGIVALDAALVRLLFPISGAGLALWAEADGWGLLNALGVPLWLALLISLLALDLAIYLQHRVFHAVPLLWRLHRMHHADQEFDFTTGVRFHPLEIMLSMAIKLGVVAVLGPPAVAVVVFEVLLNGVSVFNHANASLPGRADRFVRWLVVTPDMHRVHHSILPEETNSNFGFNLPWWDRLFGTYHAQPKAGHDAMTIGLEQFRTFADQRLDRMLFQPFQSGRIKRASLKDGEDR